MCVVSGGCGTQTMDNIDVISDATHLKNGDITNGRPNSVPPAKNRGHDPFLGTLGPEFQSFLPFGSSLESNCSDRGSRQEGKVRPIFL